MKKSIIVLCILFLLVITGCTASNHDEIYIFPTPLAEITITRYAAGTATVFTVTEKAELQAILDWYDALSLHQTDTEPALVEGNIGYEITANGTYAFTYDNRGTEAYLYVQDDIYTVEVPTEPPVAGHMITDEFPLSDTPPTAEEENHAIEDPNIQTNTPETEPETTPPAMEVVIAEPSSTEHVWIITDWGDLVQVNEEGKTIVPDETMANTYNAAVTIQLPVSWQLTATTAQDIPRSEAGIYATKRMEYWKSGLYLTSDNPEGREERTNANGFKYYYWEHAGEALWHHCEFAVPLADKEYLFHVYFLTFPNHREGSDPADYFETHIQPVIDSVQIEVLDVHSTRYMPVKQKFGQGSADVVEIHAPTFTEVQLHADRWGDYVEDPANPDRAFIPDETMAVTEAVAWFTMSLPDSWERDEANGYAHDIPRQNAEVYSIKRMDYGHILYLTSANPEKRSMAWNIRGTKYYYWETVAGDTPARVFNVEIVVPYYEQEYLYYMRFYTFPNDPYADDPPDYFETHVLPVLDSILVELAV